MTVGNLMSTGPVTCRPADTLATAAERMWQRDCGIVAVVDEQQRIVGLVTDRDICMAAWTKARPLADILVGSAMSETVHSVRPSDRVRDAAAVMREHQVRRLPVVENGGRLLGMLSLNDLAREASLRSDGVTTEEVASTLAAIGQPPPARTQPDRHNGGGIRRKLREQIDELRSLRNSIRGRLRSIQDRAIGRH